MNFRRLGAALAVLLAFTATAFAQDSDWAKVVAAAKQEGKVVLYTSHGGPLPWLPQGFKQRYGIDLELLQVRAAEISERVKTEQSAGRYLGDVVETGGVTLAGLAANTQPHGFLPSLTTLSPDLAATDVLVPNYLQAHGYLINTSLIPPAEEPRSWADLADPKWMGKILADDPRSLGGGFTAFSVLVTRLGEPFERKLAAQQPVLSRSLGENPQRIARGEFAIYEPMILGEVLTLTGLPVKVVLPSEGSPYSPFSGGILKNAPHPNAARLLMDYLLDDSVQVKLAEEGNVPVTRGIAAKTSGEVQRLVGAKLLGAPDPSRQAELIALAKQIYGN